MSTSEGKITFIGDASQLLFEYYKLLQEQQKHTDKYQSMKKAAQEASREAVKLGKDAAAELAKTRSPAENYVAVLGRMKKALQEGIITQDQFDRVRQKQLSVLNAIQKAEHENTEEYKAQKRAIAEAERQLEEWGRKGLQVYDATRTPLEKYNAKVAELEELKSRGSITAETFARALEREQRSLQETSDEYREQQQAIRDAEQQQAEWARKGKQLTDSARTPLERYNAKVAEMEEMKRRGVITEATFNEALKREQQALHETTEEYRKQQEEIAKAAKKKEEWARKGQQAFDATRTPLERYNAKVVELDRLKQRGLITQDTYTRALKKEREAYREATDGQSLYTKGIHRIIGMVGVGGLLMTGFQMWKQAHRELIEQANEIATKYDEISRKFNVQAGLRGLDAAEAQVKVAGIAEEVALPGGLNQGLAAATQLVSADFSVEEATGGSLRAFLKTLAAGGAQGKNVDPGELAKSFSQYLHAQGLEKNEKSVTFLGQSSNALMKATNFDVRQLTSLAKESGGMKSAAPPSQQLATFAELGMSMEAPQAAVGMRNFFGRLQTASAFPERMKVLAKLGVDAHEVDFVGEDMNSVIPRLEQAFAGVDESQRAGMMARLFGEETVPVASQIMGNLGRIQQHQRDMANSDTFAADVKEATSGRNAADARLNIKNEMDYLIEDQQDDLLQKQMDIMLRERGASPFVRYVSKAMYYTSRFTGASPDGAISFATPSKFHPEEAHGFDSSGKPRAITPQGVRERLIGAAGEDLAVPIQNLTKALEANTAATQKNNTATDKNSKETQQNTVPPMRPSAPPTTRLSAGNRK